MIQIAALRSRLEKQLTNLRRSPRDLGKGALACGMAILSIPLMTTSEPVTAPEILQQLHRFREWAACSTLRRTPTMKIPS